MYNIFVIILWISSVSSSVLFGFKTLDATYLSSSGALENNGVTLRSDYEYIHILDNSYCIGIAGNVPTCENIYKIIESSYNIHKNTFSGSKMSCRALSNLCRKIISGSLRRNIGDVNFLIAGTVNCLFLFKVEKKLYYLFL